MNGTRVVSLHASLRTAHGPGGLGDVELLPDAQQKGLLLPKRQVAQRPFQCLPQTALVHLPGGIGTVRVGDLFERVFLVTGRALSGTSEPAQPSFTNIGAAVPVPNATLKNSMKQGAPFRLVTGTIPLNELVHRILDHIESFIRITDRDLSHAKGASLNPGQEPVQCLRLIQDAVPPMNRRPRRAGNGAGRGQRPAPDPLAPTTTTAAGPSVHALVHPVTFAVLPVLNPVTPAVHAVLDPVALAIHAVLNPVALAV